MSDERAVKLVEISGLKQCDTAVNARLQRAAETYLSRAMDEVSSWRSYVWKQRLIWTVATIVCAGISAVMWWLALGVHVNPAGLRLDQLGGVVGLVMSLVTIVCAVCTTYVGHGDDANELCSNCHKNMVANGLRLCPDCHLRDITTLLSDEDGIESLRIAAKTRLAKFLKVESDNLVKDDARRADEEFKNSIIQLAGGLLKSPAPNTQAAQAAGQLLSDEEVALPYSVECALQRLQTTDVTEYIKFDRTRATRTRSKDVPWRVAVFVERDSQSAYFELVH